MPQICCYYWCILEVKVYVEVHKWILSIQKMVCEEYSLFFQFFFSRVPSHSEKALSINQIPQIK